MRRQLGACFVAIMTGLVFTPPIQAQITATVLAFEDFPSNADFQTFNPHDPLTPATAERTVREDATLTDGTRYITQSFQLDADLTVEVIDILFVRGASGNSGLLRIFDVANTTVGDITGDYNNALSNGFLASFQFTMPPGLDPGDNTQRTLRLTLSGDARFSLPAKTAPAGFAFSLSAVVDDDPLVNKEVFTWRFGDPGTGSGVGWYADGRVYHDDFVSSGSTETRRDGLFALSDSVIAVVPGDYNQNGVVDTADYVVWRENVGGSTLPNRDTNILGPVGDEDYDFWRARFGETSASTAALGAAGAIPEPQSMMLALFGVLGSIVLITRGPKFRA